MNTDLWQSNTPQTLWQCVPDFPEKVWNTAYQNSFCELCQSEEFNDICQAITFSLGEGQFGPDHWRLSRRLQWYYAMRKFIPRPIVTLLKILNKQFGHQINPLGWPIEERYVNFQKRVIKELLMITGRTELEFVYFWPQGKRFSVVLTHDVESKAGAEYIREVADLEENLGFRSSFNFVPEKYPIDETLMSELVERGFEVGIHGLRHDGSLFLSEAVFLERAEKINHYLEKYHATGFRSPCMHRNPEWMQMLNVDYDLSFFDTDPFEPQPGGGMSIWPFRIGKFIELPYTLVQDSTLRHTLKQDSPEIWLLKANYLRENHGMLLLNSHPDYLVEPALRNIYLDFLTELSQWNDYWHALPCEAAAWWRKREENWSDADLGEEQLGRVVLQGDNIYIHQPIRKGERDASF